MNHSVKCPYCLENVHLSPGEYICSNDKCKSHLPRDYVEKKAPKVFIGLVGFTGHGKTVFLTSLFYLLKAVQNRGLWPNFYWLSMDEYTLKIIHQHVSEFERSRLPDSTPKNFPKPALIQFYNIPLAKNHFLCFYDTAGSVYESLGEITEAGRFVAASDVVLFIISIVDCGNNWSSRAEEMRRLLNTYILGASDRLGINLKHQHLIVVLSKGDILNELPQNLIDFIRTNSYDWWECLSSENHAIKKRIRTLKEVSGNLKNWLDNNGCLGFTGLAKRFFKSVEYTIVSATGSAPGRDNRLVTQLQPEDPKGVLNPFVWAIEKARPKSLWEKIFG